MAEALMTRPLIHPRAAGAQILRPAGDAAPRLLHQRVLALGPALEAVLEHDVVPVAEAREKGVDAPHLVQRAAGSRGPRGWTLGISRYRRASSVIGREMAPGRWPARYSAGLRMSTSTTGSRTSSRRFTASERRVGKEAPGVWPASAGPTCASAMPTASASDGPRRSEPALLAQLGDHQLGGTPRSVKAEHVADCTPSRACDPARGTPWSSAA